MLGGEIVSTFDDPSGVKLGSCKLIEEIMIGEDRLIHFSGVALGEACTIVLRGASTHILDEADRSLHDALCVLQVCGVLEKIITGCTHSTVMPRQLLYPHVLCRILSGYRERLPCSVRRGLP